MKPGSWTWVNAPDDQGNATTEPCWRWRCVVNKASIKTCLCVVYAAGGKTARKVNKPYRRGRRSLWILLSPALLP